MPHTLKGSRSGKTYHPDDYMHPITKALEAIPFMIKEEIAYDDLLIGNPEVRVDATSRGLVIQLRSMIYGTRHKATKDSHVLHNAWITGDIKTNEPVSAWDYIKEGVNRLFNKELFKVEKMEQTYSYHQEVKCMAEVEIDAMQLFPDINADTKRNPIVVKAIRRKPYEPATK